MWGTSWGTSNSSYGNHYSSNRYSPSKSYLHNPLKANYPNGLQNLSNTCYISAVLQILFLIVNQKEFPVSSKSKQEITYLFFKLKNTKQTQDYRMLKQALQNRIDIVRGWKQQDAQQLLIHLLEELRKQNSEGLKKGTIDLSYNQKKDPKTNWSNFLKQMEKLQKSPIITMFYGEAFVTYTCPQNHSKHKFERYLNLSLPFTPKANNYSYYSYNYESSLKIEDMIKEYLADEVIDDLECENCKSKVRFRKTSCLYSTPKYLVLHLSRFKKGYYDNQKNDRQVIYENTLYLNEEEKRKKIEYKLMGTVHHKGSLDRGHYYANIRINDEWYEMDDEIVTSIGTRTTNYSKTVYLLFYQKV